jgi:hypothetical protein
MSCHLKRGFQRSYFLLKYHQNPESSRDGAYKNEKRRKRKKFQESPQIKGEVNILRGEKHFNFKDPF